MLCSRFLGPVAEQHHGSVYMALERFFDRLLHYYDVSLQWSLRHRVFVMTVSGVILIITVWQFVVIPKGFLPPEDRSQIFISTEAQQGISFDSMRAHQAELNRIALADPNVRDFFSGVGDFSSSNAGIMFLHLKDRPERALIPNPTIQAWQEKYGTVPVVGSALRAISPVLAHRTTIDEVIAELGVKFATVTGMNAYMQNLPPIQVGGELTKSQYQLTLQSPDTQELYRESTAFQQKMAKLPGLQDVTSDLLIANPQVNVNIDRDKASALGVTAEQIEDALYTAYGQRQISTIYAPNDEYWVIMELEDKYQKDPAALSMLYIRSSSGTLVPLNAVANLTSSLGPLTVNHFGQLPAVTISFNLANDTAIGDAVNSVKRLAREELPPTVTAQFQGTAKAFEASLTGLGLLLLMAVLVIYIVLGVLYESFIHPITILSGLPSAAFGALLTLQIFHLSLDLYGFVGVIMLIGIVKKNAIMMVDFAVERERTGHKTAAEAIYEGCLIRFRPITMTTMAALMGTAPIAFGIGAGADARRPLGLAVVGGLIFSQMVTLYLTPVFYTYMDTFQSWLEHHFGKMTGKRNTDLADGHVSAD
jgi:HAE1 family hydrophobic/amphiphilic exporter-1